MYSKVIFILATICVINASVITVFDDDVEAEAKASPSRCNSKVCDWFCRRLKKTNGTCIESHCKCEKSSLIAEDADDMTDPVELLSPSNCNLRACEQQCRRLGFPGGACVNGRCKCDNFFNSIDDAETEFKASPSRCNSKMCDWFCRRLKKTNGTCIESHCKCEKSLIAEDAMNELDNSVSLDDTLFSTEEGIVDEYSEFDTRRTCKISKCSRKCTRRGYEGATCVEGRCKCYKNPEKSLPVSELSEDQSERSCNLQACNQLCRRLRFPGGVCVNGRCKCDHFLGSEDAYVVSDATSDENEESNEISRPDEEELIAPAPSACNAATCNQWCRRLKFAGGWCRFGQCQCF